MADTTVVVKTSSGLKVKLALGLGGLVVLTILAVMLWPAFSIIVLSVSGVGVSWLVMWVRHQYMLSAKELRRLEAETKQIEHQADIIKWEAEKSQWEAATAKVNAFLHDTSIGVFHVEPAENGMIEVVDVYRRRASDDDNAPELPPPPVKQLLDITYVHILIVGPTGVGKSTVACHLIESKRDAKVYVLDPHASQNARTGLVWPGNAEIVGDGRDWDAIDAKLVELLGQMDARYKQPGPFSPVLIVSDEWLSVREHCEHANAFFETLGSEARKVAMQLVLMTISATVDDLKCSAAVRDNLVQLRLDHALKAQNRGELKWGKGQVELVELPGPYTARYLPAKIEDELVPDFDDGPLPDWNDGPLPVKPPQDELDFIGLIDAGKSPYAAFKELNGRNPSKADYEKMYAILDKFGRER